MSTILYVDHIDDNFGKLIGRSVILDKIQKTLGLINADMDDITDKMNELNNVQHVCRAGRFIVKTDLLLDAPEYKYRMLIADVRDDTMLQQSFLSSVAPELIDLAARLVNELESLSPQEMTAFEIAVGDYQ